MFIIRAVYVMIVQKRPPFFIKRFFAKDLDRVIDFPCVWRNQKKLKNSSIPLDLTKQMFYNGYMGISSGSGNMYRQLRMATSPPKGKERFMKPLTALIRNMFRGQQACFALLLFFNKLKKDRAVCHAMRRGPFYLCLPERGRRAS